MLYKILYNGSIDSTYGENGAAGKTFTCSKSIEINAVKTPDNDILLCGTKADNGDNIPAISKFTPTGEVDSSFGTNGTVTVSIAEFEPVDEAINDFEILTDVKIFETGTAYDIVLLSL